MKRLKIFSYLFIITLLMLSFSLVAGCKNNNEVDDSGDTKSYVMNIARLTLEKCESTELYVLNETGDFIWSSIDENVATVNDGVVTAVGEGSTVIKAKNQLGESKCIVTVTDNNMLPRIETNLDEENLCIILGENIDFNYYVTYNGNVINADVEVKVEGESDIISYQNNEIVSKNYGEVKLLIRAKWSGKISYKIINVSIIPNITAKIYNEKEAIIYNDLRAGATSISLNPEIFENGEKLSENDFEFVECTYNEDVVSFDEQTNKIYFVRKGQTNLEVRYNSKLTGNDVVASVLIKTELYNEDKSNTITLKDVYIADETYSLNIKDVFKGVEDLSGCSIKEVRDIASGDAVLDYKDGIIDLSNFNALGVLGQRKWCVECDKYAYIVNVNVEKRNYAQPLYGIYDFVENYYTNESWKYKLVIEPIEGIKSFKFIDKDTNEVACKGYIAINPWMEERDGGQINLVVTGDYDKPFTQKEMNGYYNLNNGAVYINLFIWAAYNGYTVLPINYYSETSAPYAGVAGEYLTTNWETCSFSLTEGGKVTLTVNGTAYSGDYVLAPKNNYDGEIIITLNEAYRNQTSFIADYVMINGIYTIRNVRFDFNGKVFNFEQNAEKKALVDKFAGYYLSDKNWGVRFLLNKDGTVIFHYTASYGDKIQKDGVYELIPTNSNSGIIKFTFYKPYSSVYTYEGTYELVDGSYVFYIEVKGSYGAQPIRTFTLTHAR